MTIAGSGGFPTYQFSLNGGAFQSSGTFNGLAAGTYTITIRDANLCTSSFPVTVIDQQGPVVTLATQVNVSCFGQCNGSATTNISGGTAPYTYLWSNGQTTPNATNLCQGITSFTVTDAAGCEANLGVTITQPPVLTANAVGTNPLCNGSSNGSANVAVFGGTSPYTYAWSTAPSQTTATATGLGAGSYNVIVTDNLGCQQTANVTLTNPPAMVGNIVKQDAKCFNACNGQATVTATNGTGPFSYAWTTSPVQSSQTAAGLCAGTYTVTITDNNNCLATAAVTISQPTLLVASIPQSGPVSCNGVCDGWAQGNATGGTPPYVFSWTSGTLGSTATGLCAGQYTLTLTDSLACQTNSIVNITSPPALTLSATSTNATCFGSCNGTATASFAGGTAPYTFLWTPSLSQVSNPTTLCSGTHTLTMTDNNGCQNSTTIIITEPSQISLVTNATQSSCGMPNGSAGVTVSGGTPPFNYNWSNGPTSPINLNIPAGPYVVTVTDANNCQMQATANVNDLTGPSIIKIDSTDATCFGINDGTAQVNIVGGNTPYQSISWLPSGATGMSATGLPAGQNTVKVIDALGCIASITFNIGAPTQVVSAISNVTHISCNGLCNGGATMLVVGGTPGAGYTYNWTPSGATTNSATGILCAGIHTVTATDANGCITTATVTINQPPALLLTNNPGAVDITCFGAQNGSINVSVTGGTAPYTYGWSPANPSSPIITNLSAGSFTLNVTDNNGCTIPTTVYTINEPPALVLNPTVVNSTCSLPNGSATVNVSGGTPFPGNPTYQFQWNNTPPSNTATANNIAAGTYNCVVTDANGCTANVNAIIVDQPGPTFGTMASTNVTCNTGSDGSATVTSNGGTAPITFAWTNSAGSAVGSAANLTGVPAGIYNVMVTDANGCFFNQTVTVTEPLPFTLALSQGDSVCFGQTTPLAYVYATAGGGTAPYTYTWMLDGSGIPTLPGTPGTQTVTSVNPTTGFFSHTYSVSVVDANNCPAVGGTITTIVRPPLDASSLPVEGCDNDPATVSATASGGNNGPYTINWQGGSSGTSSNITINYNSPDSVYYVYYTVNDGCSSPHNDSVQVTAHPLPILLFVPDPVSGCSPLNTTFNPTSNISGTTFSWDYGDGSGTGSNPSHTYVEAGNGQITTYTITMTGTTAFGCINTSTSTVDVWPGPLAGFYHQPNQTSELNPTIAFSNTTSGATSYVWNFGDPSSTNNSSTATHPSHNYDVAGSYEVVLIATNSQGCVDTAINTVIIDPDFVIYVPNAFTPNGDGMNDYFFPKGVGISEEKYKLLIFNRWGEQIFQSDQINKGWDGTSKGSSTIVQEDVYVWKIQCYDHKNEKHNLVGHVTVVK
jgi:gliding motility-associated-like protein